MKKLQQNPDSGALERMLLSDLMLLSPQNRAKRILNEIDGFRTVHISYGRGPGVPRTGHLINDRQISFLDFCEQAFLAAQWSLITVIIWFVTNNFPMIYATMCCELGICGHGFLRLQDDTEALRWRLISEYESQNRLSSEDNSQALQGFCDSLDSELSRLSQLVREAVRSTKIVVESTLVREGGYFWKSSLQALSV